MEKKHLCYCYYCGSILIDTRPSRRSLLFELDKEYHQVEYYEDEGYFCNCGSDDIRSINTAADLDKAEQFYIERKQKKKEFEKEQKKYRKEFEEERKIHISNSPFKRGKI